ncbi:MAG: hypothetical protein ACTSR3_20090 [Candidatus Helarchaeota archaeon]
MIDEKIEKKIQKILDKEFEKRIKNIKLDILKENFLSRAEFKDEMEKIHSRFDAMQKQMDSRFDAMQKQMDSRFDAMQKQMDSRFEAMQKQMDSRFEAMQKQMDKRFDIVERRFKSIDKRFDALSLDFGTVIEKIGYVFIRTTLESEGINLFPNLRVHLIDEKFEVHAGSTDVELDLFSADIPLVGECALKIIDLDKLDIFLRKINFVEKMYRKKFRRFLFTLNISPMIEEEVRNFCKKWEIKLIYPEE